MNGRTEISGSLSNVIDNAFGQAHDPLGDRASGQAGAAIKPLQAVVEVLGGFAAEHRIAKSGMGSGGVIDVFTDLA